VLTAGCDGPATRARAEVVQRGSAAIREAVMFSLNGTYGPGCTRRSGNWSLKIDTSATLAYQELTVLKNDTTCTLAITQLVGDVLYDAVPPIPLGATYNPSASAFVPDGAGGPPPVSFYGNAKISPADFSASFTLTFVYSQDPNLVTEDNQASYDEVSAAYEGNAVSAPDYEDDVNIDVKIDIHNVATKVTGSLDLTKGTQTGERFAIDYGTLPASPSFAAVDLVFNASAKYPILTENFSIDASAFLLLGATLPVQRSVIIEHRENDVPSYQVITIRFNLPS
jgi:hypothetical protein